MVGISEIYLVIPAVVFGVIVGVLFWIDYRRTPCAFGGDGHGENNWQANAPSDAD